jgi:hypothetical protein
MIQFAIPGAALHTINLTSALPAITDAVFIDGYTQPGASPNTLSVGDNAVLDIEPNGAAAGAGASGLTISASGCTVRGLVIKRFGQSGIVNLTTGGTAGNVIDGNFPGTDVSGTIARGNQAYGVWIDGATGDTIGGTAPAARNVVLGT